MHGRSHEHSFRSMLRPSACSGLLLYRDFLSPWAIGVAFLLDFCMAQQSRLRIHDTTEPLGRAALSHRMVGHTHGDLSRRCSVVAVMLRYHRGNPP